MNTFRVEEGGYYITATSFVGANPNNLYAFPTFRESFFLDADTGYNFRLKPNDVVVIYGKRITSSSSYWGFTPYLVVRERKLLLASVNDTLNNFSIPSSVTKFAVVSGRNRTSCNLVAQQMQSEGYTPFILGFPDLIYSTDILTITTRITFIKQDEARKQFLANPGISTRFYSTDEKIPYQPFILALSLILKPSALANPEFPIYGDPFCTFVSDVAQGRSIVQRRAMHDFLAGENSGFDIIAMAQNGKLDNRDSSYKITPDLKLRPERDYLIVCGVNHVATGKAYYGSISVYNQTSAKALFDYTIPPGQNKFVFYSLIIGYAPLVNQVEATLQLGGRITLPSRLELVALVERAYVQLPENIAPASSTIISPVILIVDSQGGSGQGQPGCSCSSNHQLLTFLKLLREVTS